MSDDKDHIEMTKEQQSVLESSSNYRNVCSRGWRWGIKEIHHVVPCNAVAMRHYDYLAAKKKYIENCLWVANWDINNNGNLYGLPLKEQYRSTGADRPSNLPCHNVDHPKFSTEVRDWLKINVWDALNSNQKIHKIDVQNIVSTLKRGSKVHLAFLRGYGKRSGGTRYSWSMRNDPTHIMVWFEPFSMSATPAPRNPPGATNKHFKKYF